MTTRSTDGHCSRARFHDGRPPEAIARMTHRPPAVCICGDAESHATEVREDVCYDCLVNRLMYWSRFWIWDALPGHEADVESAQRKATEFPAVNALVGGGS